MTISGFLQLLKSLLHLDASAPVPFHQIHTHRVQGLHQLELPLHTRICQLNSIVNVVHFAATDDVALSKISCGSSSERHQDRHSHGITVGKVVESASRFVAFAGAGDGRDCNRVR